MNRRKFVLSALGLSITPSLIIKGKDKKTGETIPIISPESIEFNPDRSILNHINLYLGLFDAIDYKNEVLHGEMAYKGYKRLKIPCDFDTWEFEYEDYGVKRVVNKIDFTFGECSNSGIWQAGYIGIMNEAGHLLIWFELSKVLIISQGITPQIPAGDLEIAMD